MLISSSETWSKTQSFWNLQRQNPPKKIAFGDSGIPSANFFPDPCAHGVRSLGHNVCLEPFWNHTSYLSRTHGRCPWRKNLSCGEISNFCTWNMWRKLKFLHMWINFKFLHMTDVEKSEISFVVCTIYGILLHFTLFCCKICFFFGDFRCFVAWSFFAIYALLCGEKFSQK